MVRAGSEASEQIQVQLVVEQPLSAVAIARPGCCSVLVTSSMREVYREGLEAYGAGGEIEKPYMDCSANRVAELYRERENA